jgi:hypothetical protein
MSFGRTYEANRTSTTSALTADNGTTNNDKRYHAKSSGWRYFADDQVNPEYWGVYEYKVPRSRFSFDSLNGNPGEQIYYSDLVKVDGIPKYPGQPFESSTEATTRTSLWEIDFENVIMQKIEFSWYGAVGALFLAYVPTGTGEARWVRIHHLRCSNQLKTASLGNATLPLTYTIYGGGVPKQYGSSSLLTNSYSSGKSVSEFVTKYGSSYYIDGGDRGTVRLFNYSQPAASRVSTSLISDEHIVADDIGTASTTFRLDAPSMNREDLYFGAQVSFGDSTLAANVVHVERQGKKDRALASGVAWNRDESPGIVTITLDRVMTPNSPVKFILKSPYTIFGITSKTNIESSQNFLVRNRVQVYPTKLSVGMQTLDGQKANTSLSLQKNVIFQDDAVYDYYANDAMKRYNTLVFRGATDASLELAGSGLPTRLSSSNASPISIDTSSESAQNADQVAGDTNFGPYRVGANVGDKIYGWARVTNSVNEFTLFGRIEVVDLGSAKNSPVWDFIPEDTYTGTVRFKNGSSFTHAYQYYNDLGVHHNTTTKQGRLSTKLTTDEQNSITQQIERLSSVNVNNEIRRPIPGTGTTVASFFLKDGSDYFDLAPYFDYNKDYISFPLTNIPDNLFIGARINEDLLDPGADTTHGHSDITATSRSPRVAVSLTWEEQ